MEVKDDYVKKCMKCKHSYTKQNESDTLFCSLKKCRYEEFNLTGTGTAERAVCMYSQEEIKDKEQKQFFLDFIERLEKAGKN